MKSAKSEEAARQRHWDRHFRREHYRDARRYLAWARTWLARASWLRNKKGERERYRQAWETAVDYLVRADWDRSEARRYGARVRGDFSGKARPPLLYTKPHWQPPPVADEDDGVELLD